MISCPLLSLKIHALDWRDVQWLRVLAVLAEDMGLVPHKGMPKGHLQDTLLEMSILGKC